MEILVKTEMLAESHLTRRLFGSTVRRVGALEVATGLQEGDGTSEIRQTRMRGPQRCLRKSLKGSGFSVFAFCGGAETALWRSQETASGEKVLPTSTVEDHELTDGEKFATELGPKRKSRL